MVDVFVGARYYDSVFDSEFEVVGTYERAIRNESGGIVDTEVVVDVLYDGHEDPTRVELDNFKSDPNIEMVEKPEWMK